MNPPAGASFRHDPDATGPVDEARLAGLARQIMAWGEELGFGAVGIADVDTATAMPHLQAWLDAGRHGDMDYMARHRHLRTGHQRAAGLSATP